MGLRMKNFNTMGVHCKTQFLGEGRLQKKQYIEGNCLKRGAWTVCRFKEGLGGVFFGGGGVIPQCTLWLSEDLKKSADNARYRFLYTLWPWVLYTDDSYASWFFATQCWFSIISEKDSNIHTEYNRYRIIFKKLDTIQLKSHQKSVTT